MVRKGRRTGSKGFSAPHGKLSDGGEWEVRQDLSARGGCRTLRTHGSTSTTGGLANGDGGDDDGVDEQSAVLRHK